MRGGPKDAPSVRETALIKEITGTVQHPPGGPESRFLPALGRLLFRVEFLVRRDSVVFIEPVAEV